jgi:1-acyl-sn-glycerol-3-phosphate acyltransferase
MGLANLPPKLFNPFVNNIPEPGVYEWIKILLVFPTLGLVRILMIALLIALLSLVCFVFTLGASKSGPLSAWRSAICMGFAIFCARICLFLVGFYWIPIQGRKASCKVVESTLNLFKDAPIIVCNHISYIEPIFFTGQGCSHVAKAAIGQLPLLKWVARGLQLCFVDRTGKSSCLEAKSRISERFV